MKKKRQNISFAEWIYTFKTRQIVDKMRKHQKSKSEIKRMDKE